MAAGNSQIRAEDQAREWFMLRHERELTARETADFDAWMAEPEHRASYQQLEEIDRSLAAIAASAEGARMRRAGEGVLNKPMQALTRALSTLLSPVPAMAFACTLLLAVGVVYLSPLQQDQAQTTYRTELAQSREITLQDGSQITLGADSEIATRFTDAERTVELVKGQAFFTVSKDRTRPFLVNTPTTQVRVVGTRFDVQRGDSVKVTVEEGIVDVTRHVVNAVASNTQPDNTRSNNTSSVSQDVPSLSPRAVRLTAGQQVRVNPRGVSAITSVDANEVASWRRGKFIYRDAPLSEVVADANRYRPGHIVLGAPELSSLRVTASYSRDQVQSLVAMLEETLPVRVYREPGNRVVLWPKGVDN
ncbi:MULTISPECIES: FecR family protein [Microbulbifer]|uniref:FecR family protein n=1 Tax=Microbulbifer celer TaxID=435905 RepID=A0ABW3U7Z9_9GAMM|nr:MULTISPECIES: FecR domain-containing protein [Microbulbifer]UFN57220.1 FecR domain-containing protein [Microbulbifer celer]